MVTAEMREDTPHNRSFRTHAAYLDSFRDLAFGSGFKGRHRDLPALGDRALAAYGNKIKRVQGSDEDVIRGCLYRAWGTETMLCTTAELSGDAELTRLALAWGAVQAYYACYGAVQAVLTAGGKPRSEQHNATQRQCAELWTQRSFTLEPWSFASSEPGARGACSDGFLNGPLRSLDLTLHPWLGLAPGQEWDLAAKALRTTREERVKDALTRARDTKQKARAKEWRDEEAARLASGRKARALPAFPLPQLTSAEKQAERARVRPFTLLDYLFRLRLKANYADYELFSQGPERDSDAERFSSNLQDIVTSTLLVHELLLGQMLGPQWVTHQASDWLKKHDASAAKHGLVARLGVLRAA